MSAWEKRRVLRRYWVSWHSSKAVQKLEGGFIRKRYDPSKPLHRERFEREITLLEHIKGCEFVPQLVHVDRAKCELIMTDCGRSLDDVPIYRERQRLKRKIPTLLKRLRDEYGLVREHKGKEQFIIPSRNATVKDGKVFIIDFNGSSWRIVQNIRPTTPAPVVTSMALAQGTIVIDSKTK